MANISRPAGLSPIEYLDGSPYNGKARMFSIPSSDGNAYAIGDPVVMAGSADANGVASVTLATAGTANIVLGAIVGMGGAVYGGPGAVPGALDTTVIPATKTRAYYVLVSDDPNVVYSVEEGGAGAALTAADVGTNVNLLSGTNTGYVSGWKFNNASGGTGGTIQLQLLGLVQTQDNAFGTAAKWKVRINYHQYAAGQAGV
jgi:hypothetical protein